MTHSSRSDVRALADPGRSFAILPATDLSGPLPLRAARSREVARRDGLSVRHLSSIAAIAPQAWNRLFPGAAVDWNYLRGCERAGHADFALSVLAAYDGDELVGGVPLFRVDYRLDTTLGPALKPAGDWLARHAPRLVKMPLIAMGSPMTEECPIGVLPALAAERRRSVVAALLAGLDAHAAAERVGIVALKDVTEEDRVAAAGPLAAAGFSAMASLPIATMLLPFASFEDYLKSLPPKVRSDVRAKLKRAAQVEVEERTSIDDVYDEVIALYRATNANRKTNYESFDTVPERYFREVLKGSDGKARVMLFRRDGRIIGFVLFLVDGARVDAKLLGLDYTIAREINLYFYLFMELVKYCIDRRIPELKLGQTTYATKLRLGAKLRRSWVYFKHRGALLGPLFRFAGERLSFDAVDPDLARLGDKAVYIEPAA